MTSIIISNKSTSLTIKPTLQTIIVIFIPFVMFFPICWIKIMYYYDLFTRSKCSVYIFILILHVINLIRHYFSFLLVYKSNHSKTILIYHHLLFVSYIILQYYLLLDYDF